MIGFEKSLMGAGNHVIVVDVSSDEEDISTGADKEYFAWLNNGMKSLDDKSDSTDVVEVLSEVKSSIESQYPKPNLSSQVSEDDEDCVILDGDPDKATKTTSIDEDDDKLANNDDDDVFVVGQKGEIACRDFPHPRHSCAKYAFSSTSHEKYCDMCHCYVCDIPAPCPYWCIGVSTIDHCHANDKENIWKNQREYFKKGYMPTPPYSKPNILRGSQSTLPRNLVGILPCSSSTRVTNPSNVRVRHRIRQPIPHNQGFQNRPMQSLTSVQNSSIQKDRSSYRSNLRSGVASSARNGNSSRVVLYSNAQVSQSSHHTSSLVAPTINLEKYTQQRNYQPTGLPGLQNNMHTIRYSDQNMPGSGNCQFQTNADVFALSETPLIATDSQTGTVQQQSGTNENVLEARLSEFENWLMDNSNQTGLVSPLPEPVGEDYVGSKTHEDCYEFDASMDYIGKRKREDLADEEDHTRTTRSRGEDEGSEGCVLAEENEGGVVGPMMPTHSHENNRLVLSRFWKPLDSSTSEGVTKEVSPEHGLPLRNQTE